MTGSDLSFLDGHGTGNLKGSFRRVDVVVRTVDELDADVLDGVTGQNARVEGFLDTLVDGRNVFLRHDATDDLVLELVALARLLRVHVDDRMAVLAATTGLADELALGGEDLVARTLAVGNLRLPTFASTLNSRRRRSMMISR